MRLVRFLPLGLLALLVPLLVPAQGAGAAGTFCAVLPGLTANTWVGLGVGLGTDAWETDSNWSLNQSPTVTTNDYVCIPDGGVPVLAAGEEAQLVVLDVEQGATLQVQQGGKLFVYGDQATQRSSVRGRVEVDSATLGGPGRIDLTGTLLVNNNGGGAATLTTRECAYFPATTYRQEPDEPEEPCVLGTPIVGATGLIDVADAGVVAITGGGVNFGDQYRLVVRGLLRVSDNGYLAADHGTRLELRPRTTSGVGVLRFSGDGDLLEGKNDFGIPALGEVINEGLIEKTLGAGLSLVTGTYSQPVGGRVRVVSGTLTLPTGSATAAAVGAGDTYGSAGCRVPDSPSCVIETFEADQANLQFKVPGTDASGAAVVVQETTKRSLADAISGDFLVHASGLAASATLPAIMTLRFDERRLNGRTWNQVSIYRKAIGAVKPVIVKACTSTGKPQVGQVACVDRRGLAGSSRNVFDAEGPGGADVVMVVRTTKTSRWLGR